MGGYLKEVNIKSDLPTVVKAISRIDANIKLGKSLGAGAIKIIHGYGSSGKGGIIRKEARRHLEAQREQGVIADFLTGEQFSIFDEQTRSAFLLCGELRQDQDLEQHNNGMTIIIL